MVTSVYTSPYGEASVGRRGDRGRVGSAARDHRATGRGRGVDDRSRRPPGGDPARRRQASSGAPRRGGRPQGEDRPHHLGAPRPGQPRGPGGLGDEHAADVGQRARPSRAAPVDRLEGDLMSESTITISRTVPAPPERVFGAWTDPNRLAAWWWPQLAGTTYDVDARPGGRFRIASPALGATVTGVYTEVDPPQRLVFTWVWEDAGGAEPVEDTVVVTFEPDGGTHVT